MITLYDMLESGNCYKPRLLLAKLGIPFRRIAVSSRDGGTRQADFVAQNPNAKVPLMLLEDGRPLAESNAMLLHVAEGTPFLPADPYERALVYQWLFFEQYSHEPYIAVRKALVTFPERAAQATPERLAATLEGGNKALAVMEKQLQTTPFLVGHSLTVADIALYAYTHMADKGGFELERFPAVSAWLDRVAAQDGHVPLEWAP